MRWRLRRFEQFKDQYLRLACNGWRTFLELADLSRALGEIILAEIKGRIVGGVAYIPAGDAKAGLLWTNSCSIIRMLVVDPTIKGDGARPCASRKSA